MTEHEDDLTPLRDQLRAEADALDVPAGDVDAVIASGRRRRWGTAGAAVLALVAVVGGAALAIDAGSTVRPTVIGSEPSDRSPSPDSSPTPAPGIAESPRAERSPSPAPATAAEPASPPPVSEEVPAGPGVMLATDDGIVRWHDGETSRVPGISGAVDIAFPDGDAVIFQRNDIGIGRLDDGEVTTIAYVGDFPTRTFEYNYGGDETYEASIEPTSLRLRDVAAGRLVFAVRYGPHEPDEGGRTGSPLLYDVVYEQATTVMDPVEVESLSVWEEGYTTLSVGGASVAGNYHDIIQAGALSLIAGPTQRVLLDYDADASQESDSGPAYVEGGQLAHDGTTVAVLAYDRDARSGTLRILRVPDGGTAVIIPLVDLGLPDRRGGWTVLDHDGDLVLLGDPSGTGTPVLVDVEARTATEVAVVGRGTLAP